MIKNKLTVLVSSCDEYNILWKDFYKYFKLNWNIDCEVIFVSESIINPDIKTITPGFKRWGERQLDALKEVKTEFVFWLLEDYFLCHKFSSKEIENYIKDVISLKMDRLQLGPTIYKYNDKDFKKIKKSNKLKTKYRRINSSEEYSINMQPSIWRKSYIQDMLLRDFSPWDFEIKGSKMNKSKNIFIDDSILYSIYFGAARKKNYITLMRIINFIDKIIIKIFYDKLPFKYSKGLKDFKRKSI